MMARLNAELDVLDGEALTDDNSVWGKVIESASKLEKMTRDEAKAPPLYLVLKSLTRSGVKRIFSSLAQARDQSSNRPKVWAPKI